MAVKQSKDKYEGAKDRLNKLEEVYKVLKLTSLETTNTQTQKRVSGTFQNASSIVPDECPVVMLREAWEEAGQLYMSMEFCELGNLNDYISKTDSTIEVEPQELSLKRRSSLIVKSTAGVPMIKEDRIWPLLAEMCKCI